MPRDNGPFTIAREAGIVRREKALDPELILFCPSNSSLTFTTPYDAIGSETLPPSEPPPGHAVPGHGDAEPAPRPRGVYGEPEHRPSVRWGQRLLRPTGLGPEWTLPLGQAGTISAPGLERAGCGLLPPGKARPSGLADASGH